MKRKNQLRLSNTSFNFDRVERTVERKIYTGKIEILNFFKNSGRNPWIFKRFLCEKGTLVKKAHIYYNVIDYNT